MSAVCPILVDTFESKAVVAELRRRELPFELTHLKDGDYCCRAGFSSNERRYVTCIYLCWKGDSGGRWERYAAVPSDRFSSSRALISTVVRCIRTPCEVPVLPQAHWEFR